MVFTAKHHQCPRAHLHHLQDTWQDQVKKRGKKKTKWSKLTHFPLYQTEKPQIWKENMKTRQSCLQGGKNTHRPCLAVFPLRIDLHGNCCDHTHHFWWRHCVLRDPLRILKVAVLHRKKTAMAKQRVLSSVLPTLEPEAHPSHFFKPFQTLLGTGVK